MSFVKSFLNNFEKCLDYFVYVVLIVFVIFVVLSFLN